MKSGLRIVKVTYSNCDFIITSMASHLSDDEIKEYFRVGKWFNIGNTTDNIQQVKELEIIK